MLAYAKLHNDYIFIMKFVRYELARGHPTYWDGLTNWYCPDGVLQGWQSFGEPFKMAHFGSIIFDEYFKPWVISHSN